MKALRRISPRHQITIPPGILREAGAADGSLFSITADAGKIILEPKEIADSLNREDWDKLDGLVKRQQAAGQYKEYASPREAKKHLKRPVK